MFKVKCLKTNLVSDMEPGDEFGFVECPNCGPVRVFALPSSRAEHIVWPHVEERLINSAEASLACIRLASDLLSVDKVD
jgi:hypothetical protein